MFDCMKLLFSLITGLLILCFYNAAKSQEECLRPVFVKQPDYFSQTLPLREMPIIHPSDVATEQKEEGVTEVIREPDFEKRNFMSDPPRDPVLQRFMGQRASGEILANFEGVDNLQNILPPATQGDVGPDYYLQMINMSFAIYDKEGNLLYGPASNLSIWQNAPYPWSEYSRGDPIALYDEEADRWLISELSYVSHPDGPYYEKIAISETSDPTGSWYLYGFQYSYFCDFPKLGVWHDGYYMTTNNNYWDEEEELHFHAVGVSVFERDSMLIGSPQARRLFFDLYPNQEPWSVLPADFDGEQPAADVPAYLAYYKEGMNDKIVIYEVDTDWEEPGNSSLSVAQTLYPESFTGNLPDGIPQPDGAPYLAPMSNRLMYRLQYRQFEDHAGMVANHTVNSGDGVAGIRWYEFRDHGSGWQIHQQGTYSPDNTCRWMGSAAMDVYGNIALGYSVSDHNTYPSIRFTGRYKDDPPGIMSLEEQEIIAGSGVQTNPYHRWGDYSCMSVDPVNHTTFWYTQQYYETTGNRSWQTRIASVNLIEPLVLEVSVDEDTICQNQSTQLHANPQGGSTIFTYNWTSDPVGFTSSLQNPVVMPDTATMYFCRVDDGVNAVTDSVKVFVDPCTGLVISEPQPFVSLSPNPAGKMLQLNLRNLPGNEVRFLIINNSGQIFCSKTYKNTGKAQHIISVDRIPAGVYIAVIQNSYYEKKIKLVVY
ncbi:MAG: T9SS type A sorting domain-containing protein [Bacteroidales bacterium]|nr:T9SS type A sorting domain-containing protein [Bacteroidales bacterium]